MANGDEPTTGETPPAAAPAAERGTSRLEWAWRIVTLLLTVAVIPMFAWVINQDRTNQEVIRLRKDHDQLFSDVDHLREGSAKEAEVQQLQADVKSLQVTATDVRLLQQDLTYLHASVDDLKAAIRQLLPPTRSP
jgi:cell division protein FtsB